MVVIEYLYQGDFKTVLDVEMNEFIITIEDGITQQWYVRKDVYEWLVENITDIEWDITMNNFWFFGDPDDVYKSVFRRRWM